MYRLDMAGKFVYKRTKMKVEKPTHQRLRTRTGARSMKVMTETKQERKRWTDSQ